MKFFILIVSLLSLVACSSEQTKVNTMTHATVMITNLTENSGGSGTILSSSTHLSVILTNAHVCEVVKNGGYVHSYLGKHFVTSYIQSELHDLCLISVKDDLRVSTPIAIKSAGPYDSAYVSGHPHLLPTIVTKGWFSTKIVVSVMTKVKECTPEQASNIDTGLFCLILGGIPVIKTYEATPVSALIQPGSSGSAVYNDTGQLSAVIFAGSGDIGYGLAVPHEYVLDFTAFEYRHLHAQAPQLERSIGGDATNAKKLTEKLKEACNKATTEGQKRLCAQFEDALKYSVIGKR